MARIGPLVQDQDLNIHFNGASAGGKTNFSKAPRKGLSGRKPLGDLSNSVKGTPHQATTKVQKSNIFPFTEKEKSVPKASEKVQKSTGRKALSDISNSSKPSEASKKNTQTAKLSVVAEEQIPHCSVADERFLHNHQDCIKAKSKNISMAEFLHIVGLDNDISKQTAASRAPPPPLSIHKSKSQPSYLELDEIAESPMKEDKLFAMNDSPRLTKTPKPMNHHHLMEWNGFDCSFKLLETPELRKY